MKSSDMHGVTFFVVCICSMGIFAPLKADQNAPELPGLFAQLQEATKSETTRLEGLIWQHWLEAPDEQAKELMSQITLAMSGADLAVGLELCDRLIETHPNYAEAWNKRATLNYMLGNNSESVADIRETLALESRHFGAISGLGLIFLRDRNFEAALEAFEQVLAISPGSMSARRSVEQLRNELGREI